MQPNANDYHFWLVQKLNNIILKDKAKAEYAHEQGDELSAKAYEKFASDAMTALSFVENWNIASYNYDDRKVAKQSHPTNK